MKVKDVMATKVVTMQPEESLYDAVEVMLAKKVSGLPIVDQNGELVGVLSEGDLLRRVELGTTPADHWYSHILTPGGTASVYTATHARRVGDLMTSAPITIAPNATLAEAVMLMEHHRIKRLPVVENGRLIGIVSRTDFLRALAQLIAPAYEEPATSDADIRRSIIAELREQEWAASTRIGVTVDAGAVALNGWIVSEAQRTAARVLCENVNGVRSVSDQLVCTDPVVMMIA